MKIIADTPQAIYPEKYGRITQDEQQLRKPSIAVDLAQALEITRCKEIAEEMTDILYIDRPSGLIPGNTIGYGLAARQLKSLDGREAPRLSVVIFCSLDPAKPLRKDQVANEELWMVNPEIVSCSRPWVYRQEGCLSFPGVYHNTNRYLVSKVGFVDLKTLLPREIEFYGTESVVMQHEIDHHNGRLFTDYARIPLTVDKVGANDPCPACLEMGKTVKWKKCVEHNTKG